MLSFNWHYAHLSSGGGAAYVFFAISFPALQPALFALQGRTRRQNRQEVRAQSVNNDKLQ